MRFLSIVIVGTSVVVVVIACSIFVYLWSKDSCPIGTFPCSTGGTCVPQKSVCNNHHDCPDGDDEDPVLCFDLQGSVMLINRIANESYNNTMEHKLNTDVCEIAYYPRECVCKHRHRIFCKNTGLVEVPENISGDVTHLILANNTISYLQTKSMRNYKHLKLIHLEGNQIVDLPAGVFHQQLHLQRIFLSHNNLTAIKAGVFSKLHELLWLFLNANCLESIFFDDFRDLTSLEWLDLSKNRLILEGVAFPPMPMLLEAFLDENLIKGIARCTFSQLKNLVLLSLRGNRIEYIEAKAFKELKNLKELDLYSNKLTTLQPHVFDSLGLLTKMSYLGKNPLSQVPADVFENLGSLSSLNMEDIDIQNIDLEMFSRLKGLESVSFKKYKYCSFVPNVPRCRPLSDAYQLLDKPILRYAAWVICLLTCLGNAMVLCGRFIFKDDNKNLSLIIRNLAVSDFLMGIYLFIIGVQDANFRSIYNQEAQAWISSWTCTITGIIAMVSSEVSVLLLVFMSIDRFLLIAIPFGRYTSFTLKEVTLALACIWIIGIGIATIPVLEYFSSTRFYGTNGLCFPLHLDDPFFLGWEYSALIFFGVNSASWLVIFSVYCGMFISIWKTRAATTIPIRDFEFVIRFFFIVVTDACCWFPIVVFKIIAFSGGEISGDIYGWLVVFVLPINSALNPILYTFTTSKYRSKVYKSSLPLFVQQSKDSAAFSKTRRHSPHSTAEESCGSVPLTHRGALNFRNFNF